MLTPAQQVAAIFTGLSEDQKVEAVGRYSSVSNATADDLSRLESFFDPTVTSFTRKIILTGASCAAILYYEEGHFKVLSAPSMTMGSNNVTLIVGHEGDALAHTTPISIRADKAVLDILVLAMKPTEGTAALEDLMAQHKVTEFFPNDEDNGPATEFPFPTVGDVALATIFNEAHVARVPMLIPLPMGHGIDFVSITDVGGVAALITKLQAISPVLAEWAQCVVNAKHYFGGKSLSDNHFDIPEVYFEGIDATGLLWGSIITRSSRVPMTSTESQAIFRRIEEAKKTNMDHYFNLHPEIYEPLWKAITPQVNHIAEPTPVQVSPQVVKTQSRSDKQDEIRLLKGKTITSLLLVRESTNSDGAPIYFPGEINESFEDILPESPRNACKEYLQLIRSEVETMKDSPKDGALSFVVRFPWAAINVSFASALQKGHWSDQPVQTENAAPGQNLGILTFAPSHTESADYKRQWEETNAVLGEDMVEIDATHRTKVSIKLYDGGKILTYNHLMATIANLFAALQMADKPDQASDAVIFNNLREVFSLLAQPSMRDWIERSSARGGPGEHLPYALALEIHTSFIKLVAFATNRDWVRAAINNVEIPESALKYYQSSHIDLLRKLNTACAGDSLGNYASPPSTWAPNQRPKEQLAKKSLKTGDSVSPGGTRAGGPNNTNNRPANDSATSYGLITSPQNIRYGPQLSSGQKVCLPFIRAGDRCTFGRECPNAHLNAKYSTVPELRALDNWVVSTPGVAWTRKPAKLVAASREHHPPASRVSFNTNGNRAPPPTANRTQNNNNSQG